MTGNLPHRLRKLQLLSINGGDALPCWEAGVSSTGINPAKVITTDHKQLRLDRHAWEKKLLAYLLPALLSEAAIILGLPQTDVPITKPLECLSFDSLSLKHFQQKLRSALGIHVPLGELKDQSIDSLAKLIVSGGVFSGTSTDVHETTQAQQDVDETATFDLLPMQELY